MVSVFRFRMVSGVCVALAGLCPTSVLRGETVVPEGFEIEVVADGFNSSVGLAIADDGRIFVAERYGKVWVVEEGNPNRTLFIDLVEEVGNSAHRGMMDVALDPDFATTPWVYLLYVVDPIPGQPDEPAPTPTFSRLVRYLADPATGGNTAILSSREVLIGAIPSEGIIQCYTSHPVGTLRFSGDGSLFISAGEGARWAVLDPGGLDPACFLPPLFDPLDDIGAFRSQYLDSMSGKIWRVDRHTGDGLADNPHWTGDGKDNRSKVWVSGVRSPFRFSLRPNSGTPGALYIGDVGWDSWEEIDVAYGGENFGWPCYEGFGQVPAYIAANPSHSGCDTLETPQNPGPLMGPIVSWNRSNPQQSTPPGITGSCAIGGTFYTGSCYPPEYRGAYFFGDQGSEWIKVLRVNEFDELIDVLPFATAADQPVDFVTHPVNGDVYYMAMRLANGRGVRRIRYTVPLSDGDGDCDVDLIDFGGLQRCFSGEGNPFKDGCRMFDFDGDLDLDLDDYTAFLSLVTGPL